MKHKAIRSANLTFFYSIHYVATYSSFLLYFCIVIIQYYKFYIYFLFIIFDLIFCHLSLFICYLPSDIFKAPIRPRNLNNLTRKMISKQILPFRNNWEFQYQLLIKKIHLFIFKCYFNIISFGITFILAGEKIYIFSMMISIH